MSNTKNFHNEEAVKKIKEFLDDIKVCMFCTNVTDMPFRTRPMSTLDVDDEGNLWFFSSKASDKNDEIKNDDTVQLLYAKNSDSHFLTITGKAQIVNDQKKKEELWNPIAKTWFPGGKEDPDLFGEDHTRRSALLGYDQWKNDHTFKNGHFCCYRQPFRCWR